MLNHVAREHRWAVAARAGDPTYRGYFHVFADRELPEDPADQQVAVYHWLTAVQGSLVDAIAAAGRRRW